MPDPDVVFSELVDFPITGLRPIAANKYCSIHRADSPDGHVIFKQYHDGNPDLVKWEAHGIGVYEGLSRQMQGVMESRVLGLDLEQRAIAIQFVPGERLSDFLRAADPVRQKWEHSAELLRTLGRFLRRLREATLDSGAEPDPFHLEYLNHCSSRLRELPVLGGLAFGDAKKEAGDLWARYHSSQPIVSMAHGDFVLRNIHVQGDQVGVIDFANTLRRSDTLNDVFNLWQGIQNSRLSRSFREMLWESFLEGLGDMEFPAPSREFYWEYHRRRWLMLNLGARNPARWMRAIWAMRGFARPWNAREGCPIR